MRVSRLPMCSSSSIAKVECSCVVAGRLANLDHNLQVLLIEAGESNLNNPWYVLRVHGSPMDGQLPIKPPLTDSGFTVLEFTPEI